jgi:hypothetical protein
MGRQSTIGALPVGVVFALNQRIIEGRHTNTELHDWLSEQGHNMSLEAVMDYSRMVKRSVKESDPLRLRFGLSPATLAKHLKDLETLTALLVTQYRTDEHIEAITDAILASEFKHKTQSANDNQGGV